MTTSHLPLNSNVMSKVWGDHIVGTNWGCDHAMFRGLDFSYEVQRFSNDGYFPGHCDCMLCGVYFFPPFVWSKSDNSARVKSVTVVLPHPGACTLMPGGGSHIQQLKKLSMFKFSSHACYC